MSDPLRSGRRSLPEHLTPDGDHIVAELRVRVHASGAMSVVGPVSEREWCLAALEHAKDAVRGHHRPEPLIVPAADVDLAALGS